MWWEAEYGERIDLLRKMAKSSGKLPAALANEPHTLPQAEPYLSAFKRLHSSRMIAGNGHALSIPVSEVFAYAQMFGFDDLAEREDLIYFVRCCDDTWLSQVNKG